MRGLRRPVEVQNAMLKRHLLELTQSFMIPLVRGGRRGKGGVYGVLAVLGRQVCLWRCSNVYGHNLDKHVILSC